MQITLCNTAITNAPEYKKETTVIFKKLKALLGLGKSKPAQSDGPVILVESNDEVLFHESIAPETPQPDVIIQSLNKPFDRIFSQCIDEHGSSHAILFDQEEEECFIYFYDDDEMKSHTKMDRNNWISQIEYLKSLNSSQVTIRGTQYYLALIISFSNFGERISVILHRLEGDYKASVKDETKKFIKILNRLKPPTSLTNLNRKHIIEFVRRYKERAESGLFAMLLKNSLLDGPAREKCLAKSRETKLALDETAISIGVFPRKKIAEIIAQWVGISYIDIEEESVDTEVLILAGREFCTSFRVLPYKVVDNEVFCAASDPLDEKVKEALENKFDKKACLYLSAEEDIRALTEDLFKHIDRT